MLAEAFKKLMYTPNLLLVYSLSNKYLLKYIFQIYIKMIKSQKQQFLKFRY